MTLRDRAAIGVGGFRVGHVVVVDDDVGCIEDMAGNRFDLSRDVVSEEIFARLAPGIRVLFRENEFRSIAELKL